MTMTKHQGSFSSKQQHLHMQLNILRAMANIQRFRGMWVGEEGEGETNHLHQERM